MSSFLETWYDLVEQIIYNLLKFHAVVIYFQRWNGNAQ